MNPAEEIAALRKQLEQLTHHVGVLVPFALSESVTGKCVK
jgi:hypothetical protein